MAEKKDGNGGGDGIIQQGLSGLAGLTSGDLMNKQISEMTTDQVASTWVGLTKATEMMTARLEGLRVALFERATAEGRETSNGHHILEIEGTEFIRERAQRKLPDEKTLKVLLEEAKLGVLEAFDEVTKLQMNPTKVDHLVETGRLPEDQVDEARKISYRLKFKPSPELQLQLDEISSRIKSLPPTD